jgi:serine/threonine-protein kinase
MDALTKLQTALTDRYRVLREIGTGGMATVFLARDIRHERHVALKLLKPELGAVLGVERFLSEIRVTANLQHPHLLPLFDSGEADGLLYYVMPFVEGESLRTRIEREKQLPIDEAFRITVAVASALDYAHRHNVVHRDLKPENILLHDGQPLVSDFGIALAVSNAGGARITQTGLSLGTPQYMSPEQATGDRAVDARSDIYSLACVLYEMLTGEAPHTGPTVQAIIARVLTDKPRSVRESRDTIPPHIDSVLQKALAKLPADRFASAQQFAEALTRPGPTADTRAAAVPAMGAPPIAPASTATRVRMAVPLVIAAAGVAFGAFGLLRPTPAPIAATPTQFALDLPAGVDLVPGPAPLEVAPDGGMVLFRGRAQGSGALYLRTLRDNQVRQLPGTEAAGSGFFSPDGTTIGFFSQSRLRTLGLAGGGSTTLATTAANAGATWGADNVIVYSRGAGFGLWRVLATGGEAQPLTVPDTAHGEVAHAQPHFLPDGKTFVFVKYYRIDDTRLAIGSLDGTTRDLGRLGLGPHYLASGHLIYNLPDGTLMAAPFDARRGRLTGPSILVAENVRTAPATGAGMWSASPNGTIALDRGSSTSRLIIVDRSGRIQRLSDDTQQFRLPRFSPDGGRIAVEIAGDRTDAASDIWIFDRRTSALTRFTSGGGHTDPIWTPDGRRLAFSERRSGSIDVHWQAADGGSPPEPLVTGPGNQWPWSWTPDGKTILYDENAPGRTTRIMARATDTTATPRAIVESEFANRLGKLSPSGQWLAYTSNETGRTEVFVRPFPGPGGKQQISTTGGDQPMWSRDEKELFYRAGNKLVAASLQIGSDIVVRSRVELFDDDFETSNATNYDVSPDGKSFVMLQRVEDTRQITVMVNWLDEIRRRTSSQQSR